MTTWCIFVDESGNNENNPQFFYIAACFPFHVQRDFGFQYTEITKPLHDYSEEREIKYSNLLNTFNHMYGEKIFNQCMELARTFFMHEGCRIVRVKATRKFMHKRGADLGRALFRKTLKICDESLPPDAQAMIIHDQLHKPVQQALFFQDFHKYLLDSKNQSKLQNLVFVQSKDNPCLQFADFIASVMFRYNYYQYYNHDDKSLCRDAVKKLFAFIDKKCPQMIELSSYLPPQTKRKEKAIHLAEKHSIGISTAYNIVDGKMTLKEALRRKEAKNNYS